jgi:NAD(P) transhydrogenase subunit alpha
MRLGVPREVYDGERRVAATPSTVKKLTKLGFDVYIENNAGALAAFPDSAYAEAGATLTSATAIWGDSDVILKVRPPSEAEADGMRSGATLFSFIWPGDNEALVQRLAARKVNVFGMEQVPRISRAQKLDALSSMANIAGYKAVIMAANEFGGFFTGQFTAAGKVPPAKVLVIGAGVAGLASMGAAKGLGAIVRAFDTREATREQVESMGGEFLDLTFEEDGDGDGGYAKVMSPAYIAAEMDLFAEQAKDVDIVITTALIPGRPAPKLWEKRAVDNMKPGSVIVDLASERGGNCELTVPGELITTENGVKIIGYTDLTSRLPQTASDLYGNNLCHLLKDMGGAEGWNIDLEDQVVRGTIVLHEGELMWPAPKFEAPAPKKPAPKAEVVEAPKPKTELVTAKSKALAKPPAGGSKSAIIGGLLCAAWIGARVGLDGGTSMATAQFLQHLTVFALAVFVGWQVVWNVAAALHTPLMSVTNAISGIIIVGGMVQLSEHASGLSLWMASAAVLLATINIAGGFLVTQRMLKMFRRDGA